MEKLVEQAKEGNKEAFSELILFVEKDIYRVAKSKIGNEDSVQDVIQSALLNAYINMHNLKNNKNFKTWITRIVINECNKMHNRLKKDKELIEKALCDAEIEEHNEEMLNFEEIIKSLDDKNKRIFELYYKNGFSTVEIANILNIAETTVRSSLSRGRKKIRKSWQSATFIIFLLCIIGTTSVIAISIVSYIKNLFNTNDVGINNNGILSAIENMDWYQEVDMNYIELENGYKIKIEYLLLDEMNLYFIFDFQSENDISQFSEISLMNLKITNENNEIICDNRNIFDVQYMKKIGNKLIESDSHHMRCLMYMYNDSFPISHKINIGFSNIKLFKKSFFNENKELDISANINIQIDLNEKFINRNNIYYNSDNNSIKKAIVTETGFYAIVNLNYIGESKKATLVDIDGNTYDCYTALLNSPDSSTNIECIILAPFFSTSDKELKLIIDDIQYNLYSDISNID